MRSTYKIQLVDGNNNTYTIQYPQTPHLFYRAIRPEESSSLMYSGGKDVSYNFSTG